jgi:hypothetical protein
MNTRQIKVLVIVLVVLVVGLFATNLSNNQGGDTASNLLFPDLKEEINTVSEVTVIKAGESVTIRNDGGKWILPDRDGYPADTGKLRKLLLTLADAKKLEEKTSNPELYERLGVEDSSEDSQGTEVRIGGTEAETSLIIGNLAQQSYRYARIPGEHKSWLIDQNPIVPAGVSGWLLQEILDIDSGRIRSVTITHDDGEMIRIERDHRAATNFTVPDIPEGRELSYASVVDGIAGVLSRLNMQEVARTSAVEDGSRGTSVYTTFDGLTITIESTERDDNTWITVGATQNKTGQAAAEEEGSEDDGSAESSQEDAGEINERLGGWTYQIQSYKADQLRRRWDDILKAEE